MSWIVLPRCYACDALPVGHAFQWIAGSPVKRLACSRHAWERRYWPEGVSR